MRSAVRSMISAFFSCACMLVPPMAIAQTQSVTPGVSGPSANLSDQKLDATAAAVMRVASLKQEFEQRIANAPADEQERIAKEAVAAIAKAVTDEGLSLDEYAAILEVAQSAPEIRDKIRERIARAAK